MTPLKINRRVLTWLCVYPADKMTSKSKHLSYILCTVFTLTANICGSLASLAFLAKFALSDMELSLHALLALCAWLSATYTMIIALFSRRNVKMIFDSLAKIHDSDSAEDSLEFLMQANEESQRISKKFFKIVLIGFAIITFMMASTSVLFCYVIKGTFDANYVYHPFQVLVPWDRNTFTGYIGEIAFAIAFGDSYLFSNFSLLLLFISICTYHQKFAERFEYVLGKFDKPDKRRNDTQLLCDLIRFHNAIKEWFLQSADVYSLFLMVQLIINTVYLACIVFELDLQLRHLSFSLIIFLISAMVGVSNLFLYCFFGKLATESYAAIADHMYESNWRTLSVDSQKYFILMIGNAHRPVFYHGFKIAILNLETFTKLLKTVYTFYMLFKTLMAK